MRKTLSLAVVLCLAFGLAPAPANAAACSVAETESLRSLLVPITRLSAHQGRNVDEIKAVLIEIAKITKATKSTKLRKSLNALEGVIRDGELNPGSTYYWGYKEGSAWKTYRQALVLTQQGRC